MNRQKIADFIDRQSPTDRIGAAYDRFMVLAILVSLLPLMFMKSHEAFWFTELGSALVFIIDYLLRRGTADMRNNNRKTAFLTYPFSVMAIIDLLSIRPAVTLLNPIFKLFRFTRLLRQTRVLKMFGISSKMRLFMSILYKERQVLSSVLVLALLYIFVTTLILFNVEPHINPYTGQPTFRSFFDALYWATVTLTTVDYGDMCPVTDIGRFVSMLSSLFGIAVIALPSGVITAHYLDELRKEKAC
ncbi:ion transporter [Alloprevotella tannerae]|uniref:potassium channel family protein n=1 Tax=Alloprevotella tannerae TaxID=76122 RepID=UPI002889274C|nr:ion transporter [Alloprevotella tannerae]